jgi:hypothetical protein
LLELPFHDLRHDGDVGFVERAADMQAEDA